MRQHSLPSRCHSASESDMPRKRRLEGGRKGSASKATIPFQQLRTGAGRFRRRASREGPDAKNGYGQAGGRTPADVAEGECVVEFGAVEEVQ